MPKVSDSSGEYLDLKENRNATLWRRVTADELPDLTGYVPFMRLLPRGADPIEIAISTFVAAPTPPEKPYFEFEFETVPEMIAGNKCAYVAGWTAPDSRIEIVMYGNVVLV